MADRVMRFTAEQLVAIERREGDLLLDASAGSGKTSVLVERFVRTVLDDGVDAGAILTITFTEKAAAEMRDRIRLRLRELGAAEAARATEGAFISTIHGFCARVLRAHALAAGIDPAFTVLDRPQSEPLAEAAFEEALEELAQSAPGGVDLIASYGAGPLRAAILAVYGQLRSLGQLQPALPPPTGAPPANGLREDLQRAAARVAGELSKIQNPASRVSQALERLSRCTEILAAGEPWPGELEGLALQGNGSALSTPACQEYIEALARFRAASEHRHASHAHQLLDRLLRDYGDRYTKRKRQHAGLDFEDLELLTRKLLRDNASLAERYRARFQHVMVDELQDTNRLQLELIEHISRGNLFTVGDAQQSIYAFRHADVELFQRRGERLAVAGGRATLETNFRSRPEIIDAINRTFASELGEHFRPLRAGRSNRASEEVRVELLVADKGAEWAAEGVAAPWRVAEARALAARVAELVDGGTAPRDVVVLTRATTDLRGYERALEEQGVATYVIGGRGYWSHPQVVDLLAYLSALANPRDEEALYTVLISPLVGISVEGLVLLAAGAHDSGRDPWWLLREPGGSLDELSSDDREKLDYFASWFGNERLAAGRASIDRLIDRALERTGYDVTVLAMPGGQRRLANVHKLMRLGREYEADSGPELRGFLELVGRRSSEWAAGNVHESEAPVEGEALDAVRMMTIHRAKGLEFETVCVADLGRAPRPRSELMRVGRDGRFGLRLAEPGTGKRLPALDYRSLGDEQAAADSSEERRLFYVAMTRARERLIMSGAAKLDAWRNGGSAGPISWLAPALVPGIEARVDEGQGVDGAVAFRFVSPPDLVEEKPPTAAKHPPRVEAVDLAPPEPAAAPALSAPPVRALSYSSLDDYRRCGYRFYTERVLRLQPASVQRASEGERASEGPASEGAGSDAAAPGRLLATERGVLVHAVLEQLDFRRPQRPAAGAVARAAERVGLPRALGEEEREEIATLVGAFAGSELCARLGRARRVRREQRFGFLLGGALITGALDVIVRESSGTTLIVDYKTDRLAGADPRALVESAYATQRLVYGLAALRSGAERVEIAHAFLEASDHPVVAEFTRADLAALDAKLLALVEGVLRWHFQVSDVPHRGLCGGCPAEGGLCSWPLAMTRRETADQLF